jgi:23S rRNA (uracil1939-C5)-methyltransferase
MYRVEPVCEHFGVCGGCKWQNMNYNQQLVLNKMRLKPLTTHWKN